MLRVIVFDHSVLRMEDEELKSDMCELLRSLQELEIKIVVFSTHTNNVVTYMRRSGMPEPDLVLTRPEVGVPKGSPVWIERAAEQLDISTHQFMYVGDGEYDRLTAMHAAIFYLHARWSAEEEPPSEVLRVRFPSRILKFASHFLLRSPRWQFTLDRTREEGDLRVRSLLEANVSLPCTRPSSSFGLKDVFTYDRTIFAHETRAERVVMLHALSSLVLEGLIPQKSAVCVYPSSTPGQISSSISGFLRPATGFFGGYFRQNLLVRAEQAPDTSIERANGREVSIDMQTNTVHVDPAQEEFVQGRTVLVFDDFSSTGSSLDWARNLLYAAGAESVVLVTMGKYGRSYRLQRPQDQEISPFQHQHYENGLLSPLTVQVNEDASAPEVLKKSFHHWCQDQPYPI